MLRKVICLASFVLVLGLALTRTADANLVGWWRLDEGAGTMAFARLAAGQDSCGNGNDARFKGAPEWVEDGKFGKAVKFNGSSDYLTAHDSESLDPKVRFYKVVAKATEF